MKKSDLKEGVEYALGGDSRYEQWRVARARLVKIDAPKPGTNGRAVGHLFDVISVHGTESSVRLGGWASGSTYATPGEQVMLPSGRDVRATWETFEPKLRQHEQHEREKAAERKRKHQLGLAAIARLRDYGFEADRGYGGGVRFDSSRLRFEVDADMMEELLRRTDPVKIVRDFVTEMMREGLFTDEERGDFVEPWIDELRAGLRVADADIEVGELCGQPSEDDDGRPCTLPAGHGADEPHQATF